VNGGENKVYRTRGGRLGRFAIYPQFPLRNTLMQLPDAVVPGDDGTFLRGSA
jgi:hypothetical protein